MTCEPVPDRKYYMFHRSIYGDLVLPILKMRSIRVLLHADNQPCYAYTINTLRPQTDCQ